MLLYLLLDANQRTITLPNNTLALHFFFCRDIYEYKEVYNVNRSDQCITNRYGIENLYKNDKEYPDNNGWVKSVKFNTTYCSDDDDSICPKYYYCINSLISQYHTCQACPGLRNDSLECDGHGSCNKVTISPEESTLQCNCFYGYTSSDCSNCEKGFYGNNCEECPGLVQPDIAC